MATRPTSFIWYELMTSDTEAAKAFYQTVVGWEARPFEGEQDYTILEANGRAMGGLMPVPEAAREAAARPAWFGYVAVDDVDSEATRIVEAGGKLYNEAMTVPDVGRIAMVADPQGAPFYLIAPEGEQQDALPDMSPGHVAWHELHTTDWQAAFDFYSDRFGWEKAEAMDMGPGGTNWKGAMFNANMFGRPAWLFYFAVENIDEAAERVRAAGGEVLEGPMEVPGNAWIIQCRDPQGAMFALVGWRR
jgi:predicted enzyme related to lactoylglutathione lyase